MKTLITLIFSLVLLGCPKNVTGDFTNISKGSLYGNGSEGFGKENIVISSKSEWQSFLLKIDATNKVSKAFENRINFSKETIIVVVDKIRNTGGFSIEIAAVTTEGNQLLVEVKSTGPEAFDLVTMAIVQPYHIIKINNTNKEIKFLEQYTK
jgi:hypothetical protein